MKGYASLDSILFTGGQCFETKQFIRAWGICCHLLGLHDASFDFRYTLDQKCLETGRVPRFERVVDISDPNTIICLDAPFIASYSSMFENELFIAMLYGPVDVLPSFCFYESNDEYEMAIERCYRELEKELFLPTSVLSIVSPCGGSGASGSYKMMACIIGCVLSDSSGDRK